MTIDDHHALTTQPRPNTSVFRDQRQPAAPHTLAAIAAKDAATCSPDV